MAVTTLTFSSVQTMTVTNLHSLASSDNTGWQSAVVDNTSDLALDALVQVVLDFVNTAPANSQCAYVYAYGGIESGVYSNTASGSEGSWTTYNVTIVPSNLRLIGTLPYFQTNEVVESSPMSVAAAFGGVLPPYWGVAIINHSGAALAASGNTVKYRRVTATTA